LPPEIDPELLADLIYGVKWYRLLFGHAPLDERLTSQLVDLIKRLGERGDESTQSEKGL
jgi:hypothetical protein